MRLQRVVGAIIIAGVCFGLSVSRPQDRATIVFASDPAKAIELSASRTQVELRPTLSDGPKDLSAAAARLSGGRRLMLELRQLTAQTQPGTLYHVMVDSAHDVGTINFFNVRRAGAEPGDAPNLAFDLTGLLRATAARGISMPARITIVATQVPVAGSRAAIGVARIVER